MLTLNPQVLTVSIFFCDQEVKSSMLKRYGITFSDSSSYVLTICMGQLILLKCLAPYLNHRKYYELSNLCFMYQYWTFEGMLSVCKVIQACAFWNIKETTFIYDTHNDTYWCITSERRGILLLICHEVFPT